MLQHGYVFIAGAARDWHGKCIDGFSLCSGGVAQFDCGTGINMQGDVLVLNANNGSMLSPCDCASACDATPGCVIW